VLAEVGITSSWRHIGLADVEYLGQAPKRRSRSA
jgi:hypothetical protein